MTEEPRTIRLVLDTSAVIGWVRGSVAVGELIAEIDDEHGAVILPLPCLVQAAHQTGLLETDLLNVLIGNQAIFVLSDEPDEWLALATMRDLVDGADRASAALLALMSNVDVMTRDPSWYQAVDNGDIGHLFED